MIETIGGKMNQSIDFQRLTSAWQMMQSVAPVVHIETEQDYGEATTLLNALLDIVRDDSLHPLYSFVSIIGDTIETYEMKEKETGT